MAAGLLVALAVLTGVTDTHRSSCPGLLTAPAALLVTVSVLRPLLHAGHRWRAPNSYRPASGQPGSRQTRALVSRYALPASTVGRAECRHD